MSPGAGEARLCVGPGLRPGQAERQLGCLRRRAKLKPAPSRPHDQRSRPLPSPTSPRASGRWISPRHLRRRHHRPAAKPARRQAGKLPALALDAPRTHAPGAVGHSRVQPQCQTRFSRLARRILAQNARPAQRRRLEQKAPAIPPRPERHAKAGRKSQNRFVRPHPLGHRPNNFARGAVSRRSQRLPSGANC